MASVYKRGNTYWVRFQWRGQEIRKSARTSSKREAREYLAELQAQYRRLDLGGKPRITFDQAAVQFIEEEVSAKKLSTIGYYQKSVKALAKEFSGMYLDDITRSKIAKFEAAKSRKLSPAMVKHYRTALSGIFKVAIRHDQVSENPCRDLDPIKINNARHRYLTPKEWKAVREGLREPIRSIAEMSVLRGMRLGEILDLRWRDVNKTQDLITLRHTKNNAPRVIPLEGARQVIEAQPRVSDYVFTNRAGNRFSVADVSKQFRLAVGKLDVEPLRFHDLRHTFASWYVQRGGDMYKLQLILGHKGPAMTQRYAHLRVDDLREAAQISAQDTRGFLN
ncbi:MAG: tyrosine-type recombinase/integrase [Pseudomonadota bacterium]